MGLEISYESIRNRKRLQSWRKPRLFNHDLPYHFQRANERKLQYSIVAIVRHRLKYD